MSERKRATRFIVALVAGLATALGLGLAAGPASASTYANVYQVPAGAQYINVTTPLSHGYLKYFGQNYSDGYIHQDPIPTSDKVQEIENYTGQAPDIQGYDGCANKVNTAARTYYPDKLWTTDPDKYGYVGGTTPATSLHHNVTITITPAGSGPFFDVCHYEHGKEGWVKLTFADGRTDEIQFAAPTYYLEITISYSGTATSVSATGADE